MKTITLIIGASLLLAGCSITQTPESINPPPTLSGKVATEPGYIDHLVHAYEEELLAEKLYEKMFAQYGELTEVRSIIGSENNHKEALGKILDTHGIQRPAVPTEFQDEIQVLSSLIEKSLTGAIEAGIMIETGDIEHLLSFLEKVETREVDSVILRIGGGSFMHLRAFLREAEKIGYQSPTDTTPYLNSLEKDSRGNIQYKMYELAIKRGIDVDTEDAPRWDHN